MKNTNFIKVLLIITSICLIGLIVLGISIKNRSNTQIQTSTIIEDNDDTYSSSSPNTSSTEVLSYDNIFVHDMDFSTSEQIIANNTQSSTVESATTETEEDTTTEQNSTNESSQPNTNLAELSDYSSKADNTSSQKNTDTKNTELVSSGEVAIPATNVTPIPVPTSTPTPTPEEIFPYYVKINKTQNVVNIYARDEQGEYTIPYKVLLCSTGTYTPAAGKVVKLSKDRYRWGLLNGNVYGQYATRITGSILFHSVPYTAQRTNALEYWEYDKLGTKASQGCIRLTTIDAKWVYENIAPGTTVEFYADDDPGPLGKPTAQKISSNTKLRGWDPTDPDEKNPWNELKEPEEKISEVALNNEYGNTAEFYIITSPDCFGAQEFGDITSTDFWDATEYGDISEEWHSSFYWKANP